MEKEYLESKLENIDVQQSEKFKVEQARKYGESEWVEQAYDREIARLQPILDAIDASPDDIIDINGYKCSKSANGYEIGIDKNIPLGSMIRIAQLNSHQQIDYSGKFFYRRIGSIRKSENVNNRHVTTSGNAEISSEDAKRTILENATNFRYYDMEEDKKRALDLKLHIIMLKELGIELTPIEESQIQGVKKDEVLAEIRDVKQREQQKEELAKSKKIRK